MSLEARPSILSFLEMQKMSEVARIKIFSCTDVYISCQFSETFPPKNCQTWKESIKIRLCSNWSHLENLFYYNNFHIYLWRQFPIPFFKDTKLSSRKAEVAKRIKIYQCRAVEYFAFLWRKDNKSFRNPLLSYKSMSYLEGNYYARQFMDPDKKPNTLYMKCNYIDLN